MKRVHDRFGKTLILCKIMHWLGDPPAKSEDVLLGRGRSFLHVAQGGANRRL
jgi:hypothetical protein